MNSGGVREAEKACSGVAAWQHRRVCCCSTWYKYFHVSCSPLAFRRRRAALGKHAMRLVPGGGASFATPEPRPCSPGHGVRMWQFVRQPRRTGAIRPGAKRCTGGTAHPALVSSHPVALVRGGPTWGRRTTGEATRCLHAPGDADYGAGSAQRFARAAPCPTRMPPPPCLCVLANDRTAYRTFLAASAENLLADAGAVSVRHK